MRNAALVFLSLISISASLFAKTVDWRTNQLHPLEKITVGPWDNFSATVSPDGTSIVYTQDRNQIVSLFRHDLKTNESEKLMIANGDVKQPAFNSSGKLLAFTFFGNDAQGDICIYEFEKALVDCISSRQGIEQSAFWLGDQTLGFLRRSEENFLWQLVIYDLKEKREKIIAHGDISAPAASFDGKYIVFNRTEKQKNKIKKMLVLYDARTAEERIMPELSLPGSSGFPAFSRDNKFVFFSHYLNDTNADQKINADDNSVIFRLPLKQWLAAKSKARQALFPEQLTSVDYNCEFPQPGRSYLYLSCAFEGSLDVYRLPQTGMVLKNWQQAQLDEAHAISRSYEQRLLLLNAMRYRFQLNEVDYLKRAIGNHLQLNEITATQFYIDQLLSLSNASAVSQKEGKFYKTLSVILKLRAERRKYQNEIVTIAFRRVVKDARKAIAAIGIDRSSNDLANALIEAELDNQKKALKALDAVNYQKLSLEVQKYLLIDLYENLLSTEESDRLRKQYVKIMIDMSVSFTFRLFYAFNYLNSYPDTDVSDRIAASDIPDKKVAMLFEADEIARALLAEKSDKGKVAIFKKLSKLIKQGKDDLLLRRALHSHVVQLFYRNSENKYMELFSRHWLTVSDVREMEFINVADQYAKVNKDKAYAFYNDGELPKAFTTFYPVIRQTNDFESYYQFMTIGLDEKNKRKETLGKSLALLKKQKLLGEAEKYTSALTLLINAGEDEKKLPKALDEALSLLKSMKVNSAGAAMSELLQGYIYHKKLLISKKIYAFDKKLYQNAHYHYMMALDFAQDNGRIAATVLQNLGWLHKAVGQYALAVSYLEERATYPFIDKLSEQSVRWQLANAYYYNNQFDNAYQQMLNVIKLTSDADLVPAQEKAAFYAMYAARYEDAVSYYEKILAKNNLSTLNEAKVRLAFAYSLKQLKRNDLAISQLNKVLVSSGKLSVLPAGKERLVAFNPVSLQIIANGFLSQLVEPADQKIAFLKNRILLLQKIKGKEGISFDELSRLDFLAKDYQRLALLYESEFKVDEMRNAMHEMLKRVVAWSEEGGGVMGPTFYRGTINYLSLGIIHADVFRVGQLKDLEKHVKTMLDEFNAYPYPTSAVTFQKTKAAILWQAYQNKVLGQNKKQNILNDDVVDKLKAFAPDKYDDLEKMSARFNQ